MFQSEYRRNIEAVGPSGEQMTRLLAALEQAKEERNVKTAKKALKTALVAAALCVALVVTALAVSPTLRESLSALLGDFAPYAQTVEGVSAIDQGLEVRVVSALSDGNIVQIYFEVQDLEGDRLDENLTTNLNLYPPKNDWACGVFYPAKCVGYDPAAHTALFVTSFIGDGPPDSDLIFTAYAQYFAPSGDPRSEKAVWGEWRLEIPLENAPARTVDLREMGAEIGGVTGKTLSLTSIGATAESDPHGSHWTLGYELTVYLSDGTLVRAGEKDSTYYSGQYATNHWTFPEPIDPEKVTAVAIGLYYIPIEGAAAQPGHWLDALP